MKKSILALCLTLALLTGARAEVNISPAHDIPNLRNSFCMWCCVEVIGRHQGVKAVHGLVETRGREVRVGVAMNEEVTARLDALGVKYRTHGGKDPSFLAEVLARNKPVMVTAWTRFGRHAVVLTDLTADHARIVDSGHPGVAVELPRATFDRAWDGWALEIVDQGAAK